MLVYSKKYTIFTFNLEGNKFKVPREKTMNIAKCVAVRPANNKTFLFGSRSFLLYLGSIDLEQWRICCLDLTP